MRDDRNKTVIWSCRFCRYIFCACCGEDACYKGNHFGYTSETNCGFDKFGNYKSKQSVYEPKCFVKFLIICAKILVGIILWPLFLVFFGMIMVPYILQGRFDNCGIKFIMVFVGLILGIAFTPIFIVLLVLYTVFWLLYLLWDLISECCCTLGPAHYGLARPRQNTNTNQN